MMILLGSRETPMGEHEITEEQFDRIYGPIPGPDGSDWRQADQVPEGTPDDHVWTVVDGDEGQYVIPGWHIVNYVARVVTEHPWTDGLLTVIIDQVDPLEP